jgi:hypothetical protein
LEFACRAACATSIAIGALRIRSSTCEARAMADTVREIRGDQYEIREELLQQVRGKFEASFTQT